MEQIKLLSDSQPPFDLETHHPPSPLKPRKAHHKDRVESIEPWMEQQDDIPLNLFRSEQIRKPLVFSPDKTQKAIVSTKAVLFPSKSWKSLEKTVKGRQMRQLPVLDVGKFSPIKKSIYPMRVKKRVEESPLMSEAKKTVRDNFVTLPVVERELSIERKIYLMKQSGGQEVGGSRLRRIISHGLQ